MTLHCVLVVLAHGHLRSLLDFGSDEGRDETLFPWNGNDTRLDDFMLQFSKSTRTRDLREYLFPSSANCADGDVDLHYRLFSAKSKGSIGEGSNHSNSSDQSSVKILSKFSTLC